jgi:predicted dehydrogenase
MDGFGLHLDRRPAVRAAELRTGLVGAGAFGAHHARKLATTAGSRFVGVADRHAERAEALAAQYDGRAFDDLDALIDACDALIIATPASTHAGIAARALEAGRHVLVEKPLASTPDDADELVRLAHRHGVVLQAGHQERFVMDAIGLLKTPEPPLRIESVREGPPSGRSMDVSITMDLMIHDLDLVASLFGASPLHVRAQGVGPEGRYDQVEARLTFASGEAMLRASRIAETRQRRMRTEFADGSVEIDFISRTMRNKTGLPLDPNFADKAPDPLGMSVEAFLKAASGRASCPIPGEAGVAAVRLAALVDAACRRN